MRLLGKDMSYAPGPGQDERYYNIVSEGGSISRLPVGSVDSVFNNVSGFVTIKLKDGRQLHGRDRGSHMDLLQIIDPVKPEPKKSSYTAPKPAPAPFKSFNQLFDEDPVASSTDNRSSRYNYSFSRRERGLMMMQGGEKALRLMEVVENAPALTNENMVLLNKWKAGSVDFEKLASGLRFNKI